MDYFFPWFRPGLSVILKRSEAASCIENGRRLEVDHAIGIGRDAA